MERAFDTMAAEVQKRGLSFTKDGKKIEGADAHRAELRERFERFVERLMPLRRLGILPHDLLSGKSHRRPDRAALVVSVRRSKLSDVIAMN